MTRRLLNFLTALSLLLCVAVCVLWVRSFRGSDGVARLAVRSDARHAWLRQGGLVTLPGSAMVWRVTYDALERSRGFDPVDAYGAPGWSVAAGDALEPPKVAPRVMPIWSWHTTDPAKLSEWEGLGFAWTSASLDPVLAMDGRLRAVTFPLWFPAAAFAAPPVLSLVRRLYRRLRRPRPGLCPRCGYDLRATPDGCPECGMAAGGLEGRR
jgi:hypothetical protein